MAPANRLQQTWSFWREVQPVGLESRSIPFVKGEYEWHISIHPDSKLRGPKSSWTPYPCDTRGTEASLHRMGNQRQRDRVVLRPIGWFPVSRVIHLYMHDLKTISWVVSIFCSSSHMGKCTVLISPLPETTQAFWCVLKMQLACCCFFRNMSLGPMVQVPVFSMPSKQQLRTNLESGCVHVHKSAKYAASLVQNAVFTVLPHAKIAALYSCALRISITLRWPSASLGCGYKALSH